MKSLEKLTVYLISIGVLGVLILVLTQEYLNNQIGKDIAEAIGVSFLVVFGVGMTVESYSREQMRKQADRMLKEIREDVFKATLGSQFPQPIWTQVWNHIILRTVVRKSVSLDYNLEALPNNDDFVKVSFCWSYTLCNLNSTSKQDYPMVAAIDKPFHYLFAQQAKFTDITVNGVPVLQTCKLSGDSAEARCMVPIQLEPGEEKQIIIRGETVLRMDQVVPHSMVDPAIDLEIGIQKPKHIAVYLDPLHAREDRLREIHTASESNRKCWRIVGGILPGQGVILRWYPVSALTPS